MVAKEGSTESLDLWDCDSLSGGSGIPLIQNDLESIPKERQSSSTCTFEMSEGASSSEPHKQDRGWNLYCLLLGQGIALCAASANASSFTLEYHLGVSLPLFNMTIMYFLLSFHLRHPRRKKGESHETMQPTTIHHHRLPCTMLQLHIPWWNYLLISILDVEANYMTLLSFRYTSLTSTTLLGSLTVPSTMVFCRLLGLATKFRGAHYMGVCLCLLGGTMTVWSDLGTGSEAGPVTTQHSYVGDILACCAALLYGLGDSVAEYSIKHIDRVEYLGMIGLFGSMLCAVQFVCWERDELWTVLTETDSQVLMQVLVTIVWYILSVWVFYVSVTYFLTTADATLLTLSLQTSSLWSILFSVLVSRQAPPALFYFAVVLVFSGVVCYELGSSRGKRDHTAVNDETALLRTNEPPCYDTVDF